MSTVTTHTIDAAGKSLGRVATEAATHLMGKHTPAFRRNLPGTTSVTIVNVSKLKISEKKRVQELYSRYSGYPGGLTQLRMEEVIAKKGYTEIVRVAVKGMLPKNRLQAPRMKRLTISE
jgi:large subunit ribosomal protein L13